MNTFDQKGFNVTDLMGNHYLFCDPFDAGIEVTPTHLTYVTDALYCRIFLLELCRMGSLSESLRDLYKYARPHNYQLYKLSDWDIIDQLIHMLVTEELKVWQLKDGLWDNAPEHIGNNVPMAGSASGQNQTSEQVSGAKKSPIVSSSNINEKTLDSKKQPAKYEPSGAMQGESVVPDNSGRLVADGPFSYLPGNKVDGIDYAGPYTRFDTTSTTTVYRVDDNAFAPRISSDGSIPAVTTRKGNERALFVNFGQPERAKEFALVNRNGNATVTAVDVNTSLLDRLRATSVHDLTGAKTNTTAPLQVDIKAADQFGLRSSEQIDLLRNALDPSTVKIIDPKDL